MWVFDTQGFFSIVQKSPDKPDELCVRARCAADLDRLREQCPRLGKTIRNAGSDYPFRAYVDREDLADAMYDAVWDIRYENFKSELAARRMVKHESVAHRVWAALLALEPPKRQGRKASQRRFDTPVEDEWSDNSWAI